MPSVGIAANIANDIQIRIEIMKVVVLGTMLVHGKLRHRTAAQLRACVVNIIQGVGSHGRPWYLNRSEHKCVKCVVKYMQRRSFGSNIIAIYQEPLSPPTAILYHHYSQEDVRRAALVPR